MFDVVETLFSLDAVAESLARAKQSRSTLDLFFTRLLRDAFALASTGDYRPFADHAAESLSVVAPTLTEADRDSVLTAFLELDAHPDVMPAFERLRAAGLRIATLTNGSASSTAHLIDRSGLSGHVELVISVDDVQAWKPHPAPYEHALARLGLAGEQVAMVSVHAWDIHGAGAAGLLTGWASRLEGTYASVFDPPAVHGADLVEVIDGLLGTGG